MKSKNLGLILIKLQNADIYNSIVDTTQKLIDNNPYNNICIFNSFCDKIDIKNIPILHLSHARFFQGDLIIFDIASLLLTKNFTNIKNRYFYAYNIPWIDDPSVLFHQWKSLFDHNNISIITKNQELFDIYELCWKKPIGITETFNYEELEQII
jgi:hypothetical protein